MNGTTYRSIDRSELARRIEEEGIDNDDRSEGIALVNVLDAEAFKAQHIPGSINIPLGQEDEFEERFAFGKSIVVYCASTQCDASPQVASELVRRGFENVLDYEAGLADWAEAGGDVARGNE